MLTRRCIPLILVDNGACLHHRVADEVRRRVGPEVDAGFRYKVDESTVGDSERAVERNLYKGIVCSV
jgi:hypothetical protein